MKYLLLLLLPFLNPKNPQQFPAPRFERIEIGRLPRTGVYHATLRNNLIANQTVELSIDAYDSSTEQHIMLQLVRGTNTIIGQFFVDKMSLANLKTVEIADLNDDGRKDFKIVTALNARVSRIHYFFQEENNKFTGIGFESACPDDACILERDLNRDGYFDVLHVQNQRINGQAALLYNAFKPEPQFGRMRSTAAYFNYPKAFNGQREITLSEAQKSEFLLQNVPQLEWYEAQQTAFRLASRCKNVSETCTLN